jgi:hypothetical protein
VSFLSGGDWTSDPRARSGGEQLVEHRRSTRTDRLAEATLACPHCDVPLAIGPDPLRITDRLGCPFCGSRGAVRDFLSLAVPTRPTRVVLRIAFGGEGSR